ncbi:MAG: MFS transporter [Anaerolineae bacterium]|nr:MFS transporter [Anaerolineae bacterium]
MATAAPAAPTPADDKLDFRKIFPVFLVVLIDLLGLTIIIPLLPLYAASFQADPAAIGILGATYPVMQFIGAPILGRLSDRYGRKPILIISQIGTLLGFLILGVANTLVLLFVSRALDGLSGANISTAQAIISDSTSEKTRTQGLGLLGAAFGLGFIIGPVIAFIALSLSGNDFHAPAFVAAGFSLISILLTAFILPETHPPERRGTAQNRAGQGFGAMFRALSLPGIGILLVLIFAQQVAFGGMEQIISLFTLSKLGMNASSNSALFVYIGVIVVMVQGYFIGRWSRAFGDRRLIFIGLALLTVGLLIIALVPAQPVPGYSREALTAELSTRVQPGETPVTQDIAVALPSDESTGWVGIAVLLAAMVPAAIGGGILHPALNSQITKRVSPSERGGILGISAAFLSAANAVAPVIGGTIFQWQGPSAPFFLWAAIMGVLFLVALRLVKAEAG